MGAELPHDLDVAIVGAGISGLVLGRLLAGTDLSVAVLAQNYSIPRNGRFAGLVTMEDLRSNGIDDVNRIPVDEIASVNVDKGWRSEPRRLSHGEIFAVVHDDLLEALRRGCRDQGVPVSGATVTALLWQDGAVAGLLVGSGGQQIRCRLVVLADESDPRLAETPGLRPDWPPTRLMHLAKERFAGSPADIGRVFGTGFDGVRCFHIRWTTAWGDRVEAYVVPARNSVTVGVNLLLEDEMASAHHVLDVLAELKAFPEIAALLSGLDVSGVATEVIPRGCGSHPPRLVTDGIMVVGDVVGATNPLNRDGLSGNVAVCTVAAKAIQDAVAAGDASAMRLSPYQDLLNETIFRSGIGWRGRNVPSSRGDPLQAGGSMTFAGKSETLRGVYPRSWTNVLGAVRRVGGRGSSGS